jgi:hypothetical protein
MIIRGAKNEKRFERGIHSISTNLIRDPGERSDWDSDKILEHQDQFAIWL